MMGEGGKGETNQAEEKAAPLWLVSMHGRVEEVPGETKEKMIIKPGQRKWRRWRSK